MITLELTNDSGTLTLPEIGAPLEQGDVDMSVDVTTLDNNVYTDFTDQKRSWTIQYDMLTEYEYNAVRAYFDAQYTDFQYPLLTIDHYSIADLPVRMTMSAKKVYNHCGDVEDLTITFRETDQTPLES